MWLYVVIAALVAVAIGVQVYYARAYWAQANFTAKTIWSTNISLLGLLFAGVLWLGYAQAVR